jgi:uncharacterized protein YeaO (DUF488 family)
MIDEWPNETAPSTELKRWFVHDHSKWAEFRQRYDTQLKGKEPLLAALRKEVRSGTVTMLYTARDEKHNQSIALKEFLEVKPL